MCVFAAAIAIVFDVVQILLLKYEEHFCPHFCVFIFHRKCIVLFRCDFIGIWVYIICLETDKAIEQLFNKRVRQKLCVY